MYVPKTRVNMKNLQITSTPKGFRAHRTEVPPAFSARKTAALMSSLVSV